MPNDLLIPTVAPTEGPCAVTQLLCVGCEFSVEFLGAVACGLLWVVSFSLSFWVG